MSSVPESETPCPPSQVKPRTVTLCAPLLTSDVNSNYLPYYEREVKLKGLPATQSSPLNI